MTVKAILDGKGREVTTLEKAATLTEAAQTLARFKIGAVVIIDQKGAILGILSERDIVRAIAEGGETAFSRPVSAYMTTKVVKCRESNTVNEVMEIMTNGRFRHLPVEHEGKLDGIVSIGDVVRKRIEEVEREAEEMKAYIAS
jgi:CBS domain-containing protein